ncbi:MAG: HesA/MoeB/ThiF family protein [Bacillota bacterium]
MEMDELKRTIIEASDKQTDPAGEDYTSLSLSASKELAKKNGLNRRQVELAALEAGVIPERYQRNIGTVGIEGQIKLLKATVGVAGAGGLGGCVLELLARMGVGRLLIIDDDVFADSNLNRQMLAHEKNLDRPKAGAAEKRISEVNGAVAVKAYCRRGNSSNLTQLFEDCDLVIDCLDNLSSRYDLAEACHKLEILMIHGAIAGFLGQMAVIRPGKPLLESIYGYRSGKASEKGAEITLGNPATTPAMLASWQANEAVKVLTGLEGVLPDNIMLIIDMQSGSLNRVEIS